MRAFRLSSKKECKNNTVVNFTSNRFFGKAVLGMLLFMFVLTNKSIAQEPSAQEKGCSCFGVINYKDLTNEHHSSSPGECYRFDNLGSPGGGICITDKHRSECCRRVQAAAVALTDALLQSIAKCYCDAGMPNGTVVQAWSAVGTSDYRRCQRIGTLVNTPAVMECRCPKGWLSNTNNQDGGITTDGKCKKIACQPITITPLPPNDTQIGTWGFIWGNALWVWGTASNGGKAICTVIQAGVCKINKD